MSEKNPNIWSPEQVLAAWSEGAPSYPTAAFLARGTRAAAHLEEMLRDAEVEVMETEDEDSPYFWGFRDALAQLKAKVDEK